MPRKKAKKPPKSALQLECKAYKKELREKYGLNGKELLDRLNGAERDKLKALKKACRKEKKDALAEEKRKSTLSHGKRVGWTVQGRKTV